MLLNKKIQKSIQEHLPEMVGQELKTYITELEDKLANFDELEEDYKALEKDYRQLRDLKLNKEEFEEAQKAFDQLYASYELELREFQSEKKLLELRCELAERSKQDVKEIVQTVFRSNRMNYNVDLSVPNPHYGKQDEYGNVDHMQNSYVSGSLEKNDTETT